MLLVVWWSPVDYRNFCTNHVGEDRKTLTPNWDITPPRHLIFPHSQIRQPWSSVYYEQQQREPSDVCGSSWPCYDSRYSLTNSHDSDSLAHLSSLPHVILLFIIQFADPILFLALLDSSNATSSRPHPPHQSSRIVEQRRIQSSTPPTFQDGPGVGTTINLCLRHRSGCAHLHSSLALLFWSSRSEQKIRSRIHTWSK